MLRFSACVIVKNEEKNLLTWIKCMKKIASELIVVDTGSIDATVPIAQSAGAQVYSYKWDDDFAAAKNFALDQASGDWILFLDADEYFTMQSIGNLPLYIETIDRNKNIDALLCRLVNIDADKGNAYISAIQSLRIFRRHPDLRFKGKIHEFLTRVDGPLRFSQAGKDIEIYHTGYSSSIIEKKLMRNLELLQADIAKNGEKPEIYPYLADCYYGLKEYEKAIYYAERSIAEHLTARGQESTIYRRLIDSMALLKEDANKILPIVQIAINKFPDMPEFIWNKGEFFFQQKKYVEAEKLLKKSLTLYQTAENRVPCGDCFTGQINLVYCRLGDISALKNDIPQAVEMYVKSIQIYQYNVIALQGLYRQVQYKNPVDVISLFKSFYEDTSRDLEFLVKSLKKWSHHQVYLYYRQRLLGKDIPLLEDEEAAVFCGTGNFKAALRCEMGKIEEVYQFMLLLGIKYKLKEEQYNMMQLLLPNSYCHILRNHRGELIRLTNEEKNIYNQVKMETNIIKKAIEKKSNLVKTIEGGLYDEKSIELIDSQRKDDLSDNENQLLLLLQNNEVTVDSLYLWINKMTSADAKIETCIRAAVQLYENNKAVLALQLILKCYIENSQNEEVVYATAYLFHLYGDDAGAEKIIKRYAAYSKKIDELWEIIQNSVIRNKIN